MSDKYDRKELNKELIEIIKSLAYQNRVNKDMYAEDQVFATDFENPDKSGEKIYFHKNDVTEALNECLMTLIAQMPNEKVADEEIYEIPGFKIKPEKGIDKTETKTLFITKEGAKALAHKSKELKRHLGIELPEEIYQLSHDNVLPGFDYNAPEPKKLTETQEEYEARLESYYHEKGVEKEAVEEYRAPYPHEKVKYSAEPPVMTDQPRESYQKELNDKALPKSKAEHGGEGVEEGKKKRVVDTKPRLGQKIYQGFNSGLSFMKSKTVRNVLLTVGGVAAAGAVLSVAPVGVAMVAIPAAALTTIGVLVKKHGPNVWKKIVEKVKEKFLGPQIKDEQEEPEKGKEKGPEKKPESEEEPKKETPTPERKPEGAKGEKPIPTPPERPVGKTKTEVPEELQIVISEIMPDNEMLKNIDTNITLAKEKISEITAKLQSDTTPEAEKAELQSQLDKNNQILTKLMEQKRTILENIYTLISDFVNGKRMESGGMHK